MENLSKAKELIELSERISILPALDFHKDTFPAAVALFYSLRKIGKKVNLPCQDPPEKFKFLAQDQEFSKIPEADFLISLKETSGKFSSLFFEKTEDGLNLFLKAPGASLGLENINIKKMDPAEPEDLLIVLGEPSFENISGFLKNHSSAILNIDLNPENERYGQTNIVEKTALGFSEIIFELLSSFNENPFDPKASQALLAGMVFCSNNFQSPKTTLPILQKVSCLGEWGANIEEIRAKLFGQETAPELRLFNRVLNRLKLLPQKNIAVASLILEDFKKNQATASDLKFALRKLSCEIFPIENLLILWEQNSSSLKIKGVFCSQNSRNIKIIADKFHELAKGDAVLFTAPENDLKTAKEKIISYLE